MKWNALNRILKFKKKITTAGYNCLPTDTNACSSIFRSELYETW